MRLCSSAWVLILAGLCCGCSGKSDAPQLVGVHGVILYKQKPLAGAQVLFTPDSGPFAMGETNEKGEFLLQTRGSSGAMIGEHRVTISAYQPFKTDGKQTEGLPVVSRIPEKYGDLRQSNLTASVKKSDPNEFRFELQ